MEEIDITTSCIKDVRNNVIYQGIDAEKVFKLLNSDSREVTEEDEVKYESLLRNLSFYSPIRLVQYTKSWKLVLRIKFKGVDSFNRPIFKPIDRDLYFGSTSQLFSQNDSPQYIIDNIKLDELVYFGDKFDCEPDGDKLNVIFILIE